MKIKKGISLLLSLIMVCSLFTGCSSKTTETKSSESTVNNTETTSTDTTSTETTENTTSSAEDISGKLVVWEHGSDFDNSLKNLIDGFQVLYPNVEFEYEIKPTNYYSLLSTAIQSGEAPDIFWTNGTATSQMADYVNQDVLYDLTDVVDYSNLEEESFSLATIDNKLYSVPWMTFDTRACYYNKDIFEEMGLSVPKTFSEFEALLQTIKDNGKIPISLAGMDTWSILFFFEPLLAAMEPEYTRGLVDYSSKANDERVGTTIDKALEWGDKGYYGDGYLGVDSDGQSLAFTTGEAAMVVAGSWMITSYQENNPDLNLGVFQIPSEDGTTGMVGSYANGFSVYKNTKYVDASLAFVNYCASMEVQTNWVQTLGAVSGSPKIQATNEIAKGIADCDETYISWQSNLSKYNKEGESATSIWEEDSVKVFSKAITVDDLLNNIGAVMQ